MKSLLVKMIAAVLVLTSTVVANAYSVKANKSMREYSISSVEETWKLSGNFMKVIQIESFGGSTDMAGYEVPSALVLAFEYTKNEESGLRAHYPLFRVYKVKSISFDAKSGMIRIISTKRDDEGNETKKETTYVSIRDVLAEVQFAKQNPNFPGPIMKSRVQVLETK